MIEDDDFIDLSVHVISQDTNVYGKDVKATIRVTGGPGELHHVPLRNHGVSLSPHPFLPYSTTSCPPTPFPSLSFFLYHSFFPILSLSLTHSTVCDVYFIGGTPEVEGGRVRLRFPGCVASVTCTAAGQAVTCKWLVYMSNNNYSTELKESCRFLLCNWLFKWIKCSTIM